MSLPCIPTPFKSIDYQEQTWNSACQIHYIIQGRKLNCKELWGHFNKKVLERTYYRIWTVVR